MANNCLVTKLKGTVDNSNLLKIGELRFKVNGTAALTIQTVSGKSVVATIIEGTGTFDATHTNTVTLTSSITTASITATTPCVISINDKYSIEKLVVNKGVYNYNDAANLEYCNGLIHVTGFSWNSSDLANFKNKANMQRMIAVAKVPFNFGEVTDYSALTQFEITGDVSGNIKTINLNCPSISTLRLGGTIIGDASQFAQSATLPMSKSVDTNVANTDVSWSTTRPSTAPFLELIYINLGDDLDAMLINQANLTYSGTAATGWTRGLSVWGNLGSSQEVTDAIAAIKAKGLPVHINGRAY